MSNSQTKQENTSPPPPPPPELPSSKISPLVRKLRTAPPSTFFQTSNPPPRVGLLAAPTGPYFFYGTLADPSMPRDILELDSEPELRPAYLVGYECKLWGQYPALLDAPGLEVKGAVYNVRTVEEGERLAEYETNHYHAESCHIRYTDGKEPAEDYGYTFKFVGDRRDLSEGVFGLELWLRRMRRLRQTTGQAAQH